MVTGATVPAVAPLDVATGDDSSAHPGIVAAFVVLAIAGALVVAVNAVDLGTGETAFGLLASTLPAPALLACVLLLDRNEPEPPRILAVTFLWGATAAVLVATVVNTLGGELVGGMLGDEAGDVFLVSFSAPVVEELLKGAALLVLFRAMRHEFNGVVDGIVYAGVVGLGFAVGENVHYYGSALASGDAALTLVVRGVFTPFAHPLFTAPIGIGLALAAESRRSRVNVVPPLLGLLAAIGLHSAWNSAFLLVLPGIVAVALLVFVPALVGVLLLVRHTLGVERDLIRTHLSGTLPDDEVEALSTAGGRRVLLRAAAHAGPDAKRAARDRCHLAAELAFHRQHVGLDPGLRDQLREDGLLERLHRLEPASEPEPEPDIEQGAPR